MYTSQSHNCNIAQLNRLNYAHEQGIETRLSFSQINFVLGGEGGREVLASTSLMIMHGQSRVRQKFRNVAIFSPQLESLGTRLGFNLIGQDMLIMVR